MKDRIAGGARNRSGEITNEDSFGKWIPKAGSADQPSIPGYYLRRAINLRAERECSREGKKG